MFFSWGSPSGTNSGVLEDEAGARYGWARILSSFLPIASGGRTKSTQPAAMALCGMPSNLADFSSWAKVMLPSALVAPNPKVPSEAVPERITPIALLPWSCASARKNVLRTVVLCAVALILGAVAVRALPEIPDLSGYQSYKTYDPIVMADLRYIAWRGIGVK